MCIVHAAIEVSIKESKLELFLTYSLYIQKVIDSDYLIRTVISFFVKQMSSLTTSFTQSS